MVGLVVTDLTPEVARELGYPQAGGAVISDVVPWSAAMRKGLAPGVKIEEVDGTAIGSAREFRQALKNLEPGNIVNLLVGTPDGSSRIVNLRAEQR